MHSGRPAPGSGHSAARSTVYTSSQQQAVHARDMLSAGASTASTAGLGIFRGGSLTHGEPRVLASAGGGQYSNGTVGGGSSSSSSAGAASSLGHYTSLFSVHGQSSPLASVSPYTGFFSQYPATAAHYAPSSLVAATARFPHIESYSAVLASMGTHVQHGAHASPQTPQAAYLAPLAQYSHHSLAASSSPGPSVTHSSSGSASSFSFRDIGGGGSLLQQPGRGDRDRSPPRHRTSSLSPAPPPHSLGDDKAAPHYPPRSSPGGPLKDVKAEPWESLQKVPSGKEGSLKYRILTRPGDTALEGASYERAKGRSQSVKTEGEVDGEGVVGGKRARHVPQSAVDGAASASLTSSSPAADSHVFVAPHALGPSPSSSAAHYANHPPSTSPTTTSISFNSSLATSSPSSSSASYPTHNPESAVSAPELSQANPHPHYPPHFTKGSIIQLASGELKRVEDLQTEDFVSSAQISADLKVDSSTVVRIEEHPEKGTVTLGFSVGQHRVQVTVEATLEHPFYVFGQGWSSCSPTRTQHRYALDCHKLTVGDVCISLTHKDVPLKAAEIVSQQQQQQQQQALSSPKQEGETREEFHSQRHARPSSKSSPGRRRDSDRDQDRFQGNNVNGEEASGGDSVGMDLSSSAREGPGKYKPGIHQQSAEGVVNSRPSSRDYPADVELPQKRRRSALDSDTENNDSKRTRSDATPSQNA